MANKILHIVIALVLVILLVLLTDPFMVWMPMGIQMLILLGASVLVCLWAGFVMYEKADDEREMMHKMQAGRVAYLSGIGVLTVALLVQGFNHTIDPWVSLALAVMVLSKLFARIFSERYR